VILPLSARPAIFISAVSRELRSARQLVANTLTFLGYEPVWQEIFGLEGGDLREMLRQKIDQCAGVVQLVGQCYGAEPPSVDPAFGRVSYTQYEALYARQRGKKVWYLFIDENFPIDEHEPEVEELRELQASYRGRVQADAHLFHPLATRDALEAGVLKLRDDLTRLRRGAKAWAIGIAILLLISVGIGVWLLRGQRQATGEIHQVVTEMQKLRQGILAYPEVEARVRQTQNNKDPVSLQERVYQELSRQLGVDVKTLKENAPQLFANWKDARDASSFEKATAAFVAKDYGEAERLALQAAEEARRDGPAKNADVVRALKLAGLAAHQENQYDRAIEHFRAAEKLTDAERDSAEWASVQEDIAMALARQGHYAEQAEILQKVVDVRIRKFGAQERETLHARALLAGAKSQLTKYAEAETELRDLIRLEEKLLGPEDPETLWCRESLAQVLMNQAKFSEAESEFREVMKLDDRVLGPENPATLHARNNVARTVMRRGNYAEAKIEFTALAHIAEKLFGPEHPDTILFRANLGVALMALFEYADAEVELREVVRLRTKILGPEHRDTLKARGILAQVLDKQDKMEEADALYREVVAQTEKILGPDDPETILAYGNLAISLERHYHMKAAKPFAETALERARKVFGRDHATTKSYQDVLQAIDAMMQLDRP
jgi:tetratricopeptide (TPR) repeat protein